MADVSGHLIPGSGQLMSYQGDMDEMPLEGEGRGLGSWLHIVLVVAVIALFVVFVAANTNKVTVHYVVGEAHGVPLIVVAVGSAIVGALVSALIRFRRRHSN